MRKVNLKSLSVAFIFIASLTAGMLYHGFASADRFDEQIRALQQENAGHQAQANQLAAQASSYEDAINKLQGQVLALQNAIAENQRQSEALQREIEAQQKELEHQREILGQNIKAMYLEGQTSTIEILASSNDLSDYVNREAYRGSVQEKVKTTMAKITDLKQQLEKQQQQLQTLIKSQESERAQLAATQAQQSEMLAYTEGQKAAYDQQIRNNKSKIAELRRQQIIENARFIGGTPGSGPACGGGYPGHAMSQWGRWGCNYGLDDGVDNWGMFNRECVSYAAFRVASSGRYMPYWGGRGDAHQWDDNARAAGIPVDTNPREGDIAVSNSGTWGHVMYVEHVYDDGRIYISQYNAGLDGRYSEKVISAAGLYFIHF